MINQRLHIIKRLLLPAVAMLTMPAVFAGNNSFLCTIEHSYSLDAATGTLVEDIPSEYYVGQAFSVDRKTGQVIGEAINTRATELGQPIILNAGLEDPRGDAEKSVAYTENGVEVYGGQNGWSSFWYDIGTGSTPMHFLQIDEYKLKDGKYPFQLTTQTSTFTGYCK